MDTFKDSPSPENPTNSPTESSPLDATPKNYTPGDPTAFDNFNFHSSQIGQKPAPTYFVNVEEKPLVRFQQFLKKYLVQIILFAIVLLLFIIGTFIVLHFLNKPKPQPSPPPKPVARQELSSADQLLTDAENFVAGSRNIPLKTLIQKLETLIADQTKNGDLLSATWSTITLSHAYTADRDFESAIKLLTTAVEGTSDSSRQLMLTLELCPIYTEAENRQAELDCYEKLVAFPDEVELPSESWKDMIKPPLVEYLKELKAKS